MKASWLEKGPFSNRPNQNIQCIHTMKKKSVGMTMVKSSNPKTGLIQGMAIPVVEFSWEGYKIRKVFA